MNDCIVKTHLKTAMLRWKLQIKLYHKCLVFIDEEINLKVIISVIKHVTQLQRNNKQMLDIHVHIRKISWFSYLSWKHIRVILSWNKTLDGVESALSQASQQHKGSTSLPWIQNVWHLSPWHWDPQGMQNDSLALRNQASLSCRDTKIQSTLSWRPLLVSDHLP